MIETRLPAQQKTAPPPSLAVAANGLLQRKCACGGPAGLTGECKQCDKQKLSLQRSTENPELETQNSGGVPPIVNEVLSSPGQPLDAETRGFFEPRFGHDFSDVRVHTDARAAESARAVNAFAYTVGDHVVLGAGQDHPNSISGRKLLAHELTRTIQQNSGAQNPNRLSSPSDATEQAAETAAQTIAEPRSLQPVGVAALHLARQVDPGAAAASDPASVPTYGVTPTAATTSTFPEKVNFWLHAFIPNTVSGATKAPGGPYAGRTVFPSPPHPFHQNSCFETDERGFDSTVTASSRVRVVGILDTVGPALSSAALSDLTFEIDCTSGSLKCEKTPSPSVSVSLIPEPLTPADQILIGLLATANDPCVTPSPDLAVRGVIAIDRKHRTFNFVGATSYYPAFEMYASFGGGPVTVFKQPPIIDSPFALEYLE